MENLFKESFEHFELTPDAEVKSAIDAILFAPKRTKRPLLWLFFAFSAIGISLLVYFFSNTHKIVSSTGSVRLALHEAKQGIVKSSGSHFVAQKSSSTPIKKTIQEPKKENNNRNQRNQHSINSSTVNSKTSLTAAIQERTTVGKLPLKPFVFSTDFLKNWAPEPKPMEEFHLPENKKSTYYLSLSSHYSVEETRKKNNPTLNENKTDGFIQSKGVNFQLEIGKKLTPNWLIHSSIGLSSVLYLQKTRTIIWDSVLDPFVTTSSPSLIYVQNSFSESIQYQYTAFQLRVGANYIQTLNPRWKWELAGGLGLISGKLNQLSPSSYGMELAKERKIGVSAYIRPSLLYSFGNKSLFVYANLQQSIVSEVYWNFLKYRAPNCGVGLGFRIWF